MRTLFVRTFLLAFLLGSTLVAIFALQTHGLGGSFRGTAGPDIIHGNDLHPAATAIYGKAGADRIFGGHGADGLYGGPGNDRLHGFQPGKVLLHGGPGRDVCVVSSVGNDVTHGCEVVKVR